MRFKVDENPHDDVAEALRMHGHDAQTVIEEAHGLSTPVVCRGHLTRSNVESEYTAPLPFKVLPWGDSNRLKTEKTL
jgi:hypothetical protein